MQNILTPSKRVEFEKLVRSTKNIDEKDRLRAILAYDEGHDVRDIADILKISDSTTYNYINDYLRQNKIAHSPRGGSDSPDNVVILDNASFHKDPELRIMAEEFGIRIVYLPAYSLDLNPIEKFWANLKRSIGKMIKKCESLQEAITQAFKITLSS